MILMLSSTITVLVPVLFVVLLGYAAGRAKDFDADQVAGINELVLDFAFPALLFVGIVGIPRTQLGQDLSFFLVVLVALVGMYLVALLVGRLVLGLTTSAAALLALGVAYPSTSFFGPSILEQLFGPSATVAIASFAIVENIVLVTLTIVVLELAREAHRAGAKVVPQGADVKAYTAEAVPTPKTSSAEPSTGAVILHAVWRAVKAPVVWVPVIAFLIVLSGIQVPSLIDSMLNLIGQTTSGLALFLAGLVLAAYSVRVNRAVVTGVALKSVVEPALMLALVLAAGIHGPLAGAGIIGATLPAAIVAVNLAGRYRTYQSEAGSTLLLTAILLIVVVPVFTFLAG
jgi:malonate transporter